MKLIEEKSIEISNIFLLIIQIEIVRYILNKHHKIFIENLKNHNFKKIIKIFQISIYLSIHVCSFVNIFFGPTLCYLIIVNLSLKR